MKWALVYMKYEPLAGVYWGLAGVYLVALPIGQPNPKKAEICQPHHLGKGALTIHGANLATSPPNVALKPENMMIVRKDPLA